MHAHMFNDIQGSTSKDNLLKYMPCKKMEISLYLGNSALKLHLYHADSVMPVKYNANIYTRSTAVFALKIYDSKEQFKNNTMGSVG